MSKYFKQLNYTIGDEDASFEMHALSKNAKHVLAIADCGSRLVPLLTKTPKKLTCVDISSYQLAIAELRLMLLEKCDAETYCAFLGYNEQMSAVERKQIFDRLPLTQETSDVLRKILSSVHWNGLVYFGKFERMLITLSRIVKLIAGKRALRIFDCKTLEEQRRYYREEFPHRRWKIVLLLLGNSTALNSLLYKGEFPKKNLPQSYLDIYKNIFEQLLTKDLARNSFFLQMIFLGRIKYKEGLPVECDPEVFGAAKEALSSCEISFLKSDIFEAAAKHNDVDFLSFSDVPSFLPDDVAHNCLQAIKPSLANEAIVVVRGHVRLVHPNIQGFRDISHANIAFAKRESTQLWTINTYQMA